jgi:hypothetical protein
MSPKRAARTRFVLGRALFLTLAACCVLIPVTAAALNGFFPGLGQHAAQPVPLTALPTTLPTTLPTGAMPELPPLPAQGYRSVPASGTIFGHLGGLGLAALLGAALIVATALSIRILRRRRHD